MRRNPLRRRLTRTQRRNAALPLRQTARFRVLKNVREVRVANMVFRQPRPHRKRDQIVFPPPQPPLKPSPFLRPFDSRIPPKPPVKVRRNPHKCPTRYPDAATSEQKVHLFLLRRPPANPDATLRNANKSPTEIPPNVPICHAPFRCMG